jgi:hypothetical protein
MRRRPLPCVLHRILLVSLAASCGGRVGGGDTGGEAVDGAAYDAISVPPDVRVVDGSAYDVAVTPDATLDAALDAPWDAGTCRTTGAPDAGTPASCEYELPFYGDPLTCGLDHSPGPQDVCGELCWAPGSDGGHDYASCQLIEVDGGQMLQCQVGCLGRRPQGLRGLDPSRRALSRVGDYLARAAYLEAAAVDAFQILARELAAHGAPARLLGALEQAARDEVRHARETAALARRHGGAPRVPVRSKRGPVRALDAIAIENAVEGCVRETYGALVAGWQARAAHDGAAKRLMTRIAPDEARHAQLSWAIARWMDRRLDRESKARVREATRASAADLARELRAEPPGEIVLALGLPRAEDAARLHAGLERALWA